MGRTHKDLGDSREARRDLLQRLEHTIIESILVHNRSDKAKDLTVERRYEQVKAMREEFLDAAMEKSGDMDIVVDIEEFKRAFRVGFEGSRGQGKTLSRFPQNICRVMVKFYTEPGDVVVDPFAGHNSRMEATFRSGRHYYGQDLCSEFMTDNRIVRDMLLNENSNKLFMKKPELTIELSEGDSRSLPWPDNFGDFTITSPPYWDLEYYGPEERQLGNGTYEQFLEGMYEVAKENFRVLKPGAYCVWFINDFRVDGKFYNYHGDTIDLMKRAGFIQHDILIVDLGPSLRSVFLQSAFKAKILPKRHEYGVVMRKPLM